LADPSGKAIQLWRGTLTETAGLFINLGAERLGAPCLPTRRVSYPMAAIVVQMVR
jgi:hypothetical protein